LNKRQIFRNAVIVVNIVTTLIIKHYIDEKIEVSHVIVLMIIGYIHPE